MGEGVGRPDDMPVVRDDHLAAVATADVVLREVVEGLTARGILSNAVVVLTADHGEEFYEHGAVGHGTNLFDETLRIPLLLHAPGRMPEIVPNSVSLLDVAPTILELIGAEPEARFEGRSLLPRAPSRAKRPMPSSCRHPLGSPLPRIAPSCTGMRSSPPRRRSRSSSSIWHAIPASATPTLSTRLPARRSGGRWTGSGFGRAGMPERRSGASSTRRPENGCEPSATSSDAQTLTSSSRSL